MLNGLFIVIILASILLAASTGQMQALTSAILQDSRKAVELAIGLVGVMAFFLGLMRVAQDGGLLRIIARTVGPLMRKIFPGVPADHPAMSAMILNIASNMLGLANAATPFGIKAMEELDKLNGRKGTATNDMVLFLAGRDLPLYLVRQQHGDAGRDHGRFSAVESAHLQENRPAAARGARRGRQE